MTQISDENFATPDEINVHPCVTADRWLNAVPETVTINQVCQDVYNTSLVIFNISLVGAFLFTPTLKIIAVDGDNSYEINGIIAEFAQGHYKNPELPINTNCATWHGELVFDVGSVIPDYLKAASIDFRLEMVGQVPLAYNVSYPAQTAVTNYVWNKGVIPSPVNLTYLGGELGVTFEYNGAVDCSCDISCSTATGVIHNISFCPDEQQTVTLYQDPNSADPFSVIIQLSDTIGNLSSLEFQTVFNTKPKEPIITVGEKPKRISVNILRQSANGIEVNEEVQYQVMKYLGSPANYTVWKDWSRHDWTSFIDYDVLPGQTYGYALRFRGMFNDESELSEWTEITI
tara:strand:+ start:113834 stop:114865 length:1032 start_codon:yes stop_codon:yes gene_type:complete